MSDTPDDEQPWYEQVVLPYLLRVARNAYAAAVRKALAMADCEDLPRNGAFVIGSLARSSAPLGAIIKDLQVSKQAAGQLIDTLVLRGYLAREVDAQDRRRLTLSLTDRGMAAHMAARGATEAIDARLAARMPAEHIAHGRRMLAELAYIAHEDEAGGVQA